MQTMLPNYCPFSQINLSSDPGIIGIGLFGMNLPDGLCVIWSLRQILFVFVLFIVYVPKQIGPTKRATPLALILHCGDLIVKIKCIPSHSARILIALYLKKYILVYR